MQDLNNYWRAKCAGDRLPSRQDIDPVDIPKLLPTVYLIDIERETTPPRFRFRLLGNVITEMFQRNSTGKWLDEIYDAEFYHHISTDYLNIIRTKQPSSAVLNMPVVGREYIKYERLVCPLASDGETVDSLIGVIAFSNRRAPARATMRGAAMSALGHKRTLGSGRGMSALPPKADIEARPLNVCF